ncbi:protein disulfide-isomerase [Athalia rosae]|uniref:protein disulfide-isomerase n=1 Tax=Athalia rosae TaxID=37344 RepID=UPI0006250BEB|nr:protein disulfide-isomerase [Athalia rosae]
MKLVPIICLVFVTVAAVFGDETPIKEEDGVLIITKKNFQEAITDNQYILIEFHAPWCGNCKALAPEYVKAAKQLVELGSEVKLGKVDATEETDLSEEYGIRHYPTLKFFHKGSAIEYTGGHQADDIVNWLVKKTGPPAKDLTSVDEAKTFIEANNVAIVGFFKDPESDAAKLFLNVAYSIDDQPFGISSSENVFAEYEAEDGKIILFKKFDEGKAVFESELSEEALKRFVASQSLPLIVEFNHNTAQKIFGGDIKSHLLLFLSKEAGDFDKYVEGIKEAAKKFREQVLFVIINADEADHKRILEFFGMSEKEVPAMRLVKLEEEMAKYKPDNAELSPENVLAFVTAFTEGKLKKHLLSQDLPEDWDKEPVKVLVTTNFDEIVFDTKKDVLVEFYAPWCGHCKQLIPVYDALGEKFKDSETVVIAKMDATANELEHTKISSFPTIKLYQKGDNKVIEYSGERTLEGLSKFLETGGEYGQSAEEAEEEDEDDDVPRKDEL